MSSADLSPPAAAAPAAGAVSTLAGMEPGGAALSDHGHHGHGTPAHHLDLGHFHCAQRTGACGIYGRTISSNQWTWQKYEFDWAKVEKDWKRPTLPDGTEWDPEDEDSRHYLNGFVGKGKKCEYLNPSTDEWAKKHIAAQKRLEAKSSKRRSRRGRRIAGLARLAR